MADEALRAAVRHRSVFRELGLLAEALFGERQKLFAFLDGQRADDPVALAQPDAAYASGGPSHAPGVVLPEAVGVSARGGDHDVAASVGEQDSDDLVVFVERYRPLALLELVFVLAELRAFDDALCGHHRQISFVRVVEVVDRQYLADLLARLGTDYVDDIGALGVPAGLGDVVRLPHIDLAFVGEEHEVGMAVDDENLLDEVIVLSRHSYDALSAAALGGVCVGGKSLDISGVRHRDGAVVLLDEILDLDVVLGLDDLGAAGIGVFSLDLGELFLYDLLHPADIGEDRAELFDPGVEGVHLLQDLVALEAGQPAERHIDDRLRLNVGKRVSLAEGGLRFGYRGRFLHKIDDIVDVVGRDLVALEDVDPREGLLKLELGPAGDDRLLMGDVFVEYTGQREDLRLASDEREHVDGAGVLELRVFVELAEDYLPVGVPAVLDDDTHAVAAGFVAHVGDALDALVLDEAGDRLAEQGFVDAVGDLGDDYPVVLVLDPGAGPDHYPALSGEVGLLYPVRAVDNSGGREIRALEAAHEIECGAVGVLHAVYDGVDRLSEVVRRDVGRHTDGDADRSVNQQIGESGGKDGGLFAPVVKVAVHHDDLLVDVAEHLVGDLRHPRLGVTVGGRRVTVDRSEVAVALDEGVSQGKVLRHPDHRSVDGGVSVGMIASQHVSDRRGRLAEGPVGGQMILVHGPHYAALARLHAVPYVGERPRRDDRHRVFYEGVFDLPVHLDIDYLLIREGEIGVVAVFVIHDYLSP